MSDIFAPWDVSLSTSETNGDSLTIQQQTYLQADQINKDEQLEQDQKYGLSKPKRIILTADIKKND